MLILKELWLDSRISFNALGKRLKVSGNILKKRADKLEANKVLFYHTNPVYSQFGYGLIVFEADIPKKDRDFYIDKISSNFDEVYDIILSLSTKCAITTLLPFDSSESGVTRETINGFKKRFTDKIKDIPLGTHYKLFHGKPNRLSLKPMELRLIRLLREYSRRDLNDLSLHLELSKKTLSRYLQKLDDFNLINHTIGLQPSKIIGFVVNILFIEFKSSQDLFKKVEFLKEKTSWVSYYVFVEPPGCFFYVYSESLAKMENYIKSLYESSEIDLKEIKVFFPSSIVRFEKWKEMIIPDDEKES
jgi:DNA-binding Lrp family transcriptional regulator